LQLHVLVNQGVSSWI